MNPIDIKKQGNYITQGFGNVWISDHDQTINGIQLHSGDNVYKKVFGLDGHNGIDFAAPLGEPIYAIFDGFIIEQTSKNTGYGLRICHKFKLGNNWYMAVYGHMQRLENDESFGWDWNKTDKPVKEGQVIGYVNSTGFSNGNHLHLGVYACAENGTYLNVNNGFGGSIDPWPLLTRKEKMPQFKTQRKGQELRIVLQASTEEEWKALCAVFGVDPVKQPDEEI